MPPLTPSRALLVLTVFVLVSFLWTYGLPREYTTPSLPIISQDAPKLDEEPIAGQLIPEPLVENDGAGKTTPNNAGELDGTQDEGAATTLATDEKSSAPTTSPSTAINPETDCKDVRGASDVMVVVHTSKAEMRDKLPTDLKTLLSCVPNFLIFSDHVGKIEGFPVHDALDSITNTTKSQHDEFREYDRVQKDKDYKPSAEKSKALDKWKYLPMVYKMAMLAPNHKFYIFVEADMSLSWTNLLQWLEHPDYRIPYYSGVPNGDERYAQGESGIMLSYGALQQYTRTYEQRYEAEWESQLSTESRGDRFLATAMKHSRVEFYSSFPLLQSETPSTLEWTQRFWCTPVVSWQHDIFMDSQKEWTRKHGWATPFVQYNAFEQFVKPYLVEQKEDWDNIASHTQIVAEKGRREKLAKQKEEQQAKEKAAEGSKDDSNNTSEAFPPASEPQPSPGPELVKSAKLAKREEPPKVEFEAAADSPQNCQAVCRQREDCLQWKYTTKGDGECHLGKAIRLGSKIANQNLAEKWTSGWILDRVDRVTEGWGKCEKAEWRFNQ